MTAWPMIERCMRAQWQGLPAELREVPVEDQFRWWHYEPLPSGVEERMIPLWEISRWRTKYHSTLRLLVVKEIR